MFCWWSFDMNKFYLFFVQIVNMNVGFFGIQFSFGLQQVNMSLIYQMFGVDGKSLFYFWLVGFIIGLLVQFVIGVMSDCIIYCLGWCMLYFLIGVLICLLGLLVMFFSLVFWFVVGLLWILDVVNNVMMEFYCVYVSD